MPRFFSTDLDRSVEIVGRNLRADLSQKPLGVGVLRLEKD